MFVTFDRIEFHPNYPREPRVGDVVILNGDAQRVIKSVVIDARTGEFFCTTTNVVDATEEIERIDDGPRAKDVQPGKHKPGKRH